jgi:hypothetical protein
METEGEIMIKTKQEQGMSLGVGSLPVPALSLLIKTKEVRASLDRFRQRFAAGFRQKRARREAQKVDGRYDHCRIPVAAESYN